MFYDLRLAETREAQAQLAREYGIYGFAYYHYWFSGKQLLQLPFDEVLASGQPDFPFCLCWANENWTRTWDGLERNTLVAQAYSEDDDRRHIRWLAKAFEDRRYIRVNGRPLLLVYRASELPSAQTTASIWREEARKIGLGELYLARVEHFSEDAGDPVKIGFDAAVDFQPNGRSLGPPLNRGFFARAAREFGSVSGAYHTHTRYDYTILVENALREIPPPYKRFPCVTPSWDDTPRRPSKATILVGSTPAAYERWLRRAIVKFVPLSPGEDLVFINAWNEWGEGNHLEPCLKWGRAYLEATKNALLVASGEKRQDWFQRLRHCGASSLP